MHTMTALLIGQFILGSAMKEVSAFVYLATIEVSFYVKNHHTHFKGRIRIRIRKRIKSSYIADVGFGYDPISTWLMIT